jgi:hypothetical protein
VHWILDIFSQAFNLKLNFQSTIMLTLLYAIVTMAAAGSACYQGTVVSAPSLCDSGYFCEADGGAVDGCVS